MGEFREGLQRARSHIFFVISLLCVIAVVLRIEPEQPVNNGKGKVAQEWAPVVVGEGH